MPFILVVTILAFTRLLSMISSRQGANTNDEDPAQDFSNLKLRSVEQAIAGIGEGNWMFAVVFLNGNQGLSIKSE